MSMSSARGTIPSDSIFAPSLTMEASTSRWIVAAAIGLRRICFSIATCSMIAVTSGSTSRLPLA